MIERKIAAMHKLYGTCGVFVCKQCKHLDTYKYRDRSYSKCELYGDSRGESTDWRQAWRACGMFDTDIDMERWEPVLERLKHSKKNEPPIDGQMKIGV